MTRANDALVLDASVAASWHLPGEPYSAQALQLLSQFQDGRATLIAPLHILYEVPSAITVATRGKQARLTVEQARAEIDAFLMLGLPTTDGTTLPRAAYEVAIETGIAFYDGLYVALSQQLNVPLITADRRLYLRIQRHVAVLWIADWARQC